MSKMLLKNTSSHVKACGKSSVPEAISISKQL